MIFAVYPELVDELNLKEIAQHVEWDLNKTSKTLTETLTALFLTF